MINRKRRIAELEDRNDRLTARLTQAEHARDAYRAAAETAARQFVKADADVRRLDGRVKRLTEQIAEARASKYDCAAHGAELANQARVVKRLTEQLFDAMGYDAEQRTALGLTTQPAHADAA